MVLDEAKLNEFIGRTVGEWGAIESALLTFIGDKLGLFKAMAGTGGALTPEELAKKTSTHPRMIREWLAAQAAGGFVTYNPSAGSYTLPEEQAFALTNENSPAYIVGFYQIVAGLYKDQEKIIDAFRTGKGLGWGDHHHYLFEGTERFYKPSYVANLTTSWIPALGIQEKLQKGDAKVADVGCGHGITTILMAKEYPNSKIIGFDYHRPSIERARKEAEKEGLNNITFEVAGSTDYPSDDYDLVTFFDSFHDMGNPSAAAKHVLQTLKKKDGTWMLVEPFANDKVEDNFNPIGRAFYSGSTMICVPASLSENGPALGAQAGEERIREVVMSAGFSKFRRATQTPFNLVFEARP
jgi:SAM-dependent methyltransferase